MQQRNSIIAIENILLVTVMLINHTIKIGVANSISIDVGFDPVDTIEYAKLHHFELVQIFVNQEILGKPEIIERLHAEQSSFANMYFHASGYFNAEFFKSRYSDMLSSCIASFKVPHFIIHFDENYDARQILSYAKQGSVINRIYIENYFSGSGKHSSRQNISRFLELFENNSWQTELFPVLDIPRFFHAKTGFSTDESLRRIAMLTAGIACLNLPVLLHVIDCKDPAQSRKSFCSIGEGYIPYMQVFDILRQKNIMIEGIILEYEDKANPLTSRSYLEKILID